MKWRFYLTAKSTWDMMSELSVDSNFLVICAFALFGLYVSLRLAMVFPLMADSVALLGELS
jgi:hypothetical protein